MLFDLFFFISDEYEEFIPEGFIGGQYPIQYLGEIMQIKARNDNADEFCLSVCQNSGNLILLVIQFH